MHKRNHSKLVLCLDVRDGKTSPSDANLQVREDTRNSPAFLHSWVPYANADRDSATKPGTGTLQLDLHTHTKGLDPLGNWGEKNPTGCSRRGETGTRIAQGLLILSSQISSLWLHKPQLGLEGGFLGERCLGGQTGPWPWEPWEIHNLQLISFIISSQPTIKCGFLLAFVHCLSPPHPPFFQDWSLRVSGMLSAGSNTQKGVKANLILVAAGPRPH